MRKVALFILAAALLIGALALFGSPVPTSLLKAVQSGAL